MTDDPQQQIDQIDQDADQQKEAVIEEEAERIQSEADQQIDDLRNQNQ